MRRSCFAALMIIMAVLLGLPVTAQSYTDHCCDTSGDNVKTYNGFVSTISDFSLYSGWMPCDDKTVLSIGGQTASAVYKVSGSDMVEVEIYAENGTVAAPYSTDSYHLGMYAWDSFSNLRRCFYDSNCDTVFVKDVSGIYTLRATYIDYILKKDEKPVDADSRYYGLNIEVSKDGVSYKPLNKVQLKKIESQKIAMGYGGYFHETYISDIPAQTSHVRLTLRACRMIRGENFPDIPMSENALLLSRVTFNGVHLQTGTADSESSKPNSDVSSSSQGEASSSSQGEASSSSQGEASSSSQGEASSSSQGEVSSSSQGEVSSSSQGEVSSSSQEESRSSSGKSSRKQNNSYNIIPMGINRPNNEHFIIDTYNGNGDTRAAVRVGERTGERSYSQSVTASSKTGVISEPNSVSEPDQVVVHTELDGHVKKTKMPLNDGNMLAAFTGVTGSISMIAFALWKLHP
ncbi:hypothetical protein V6615_04345 [Oscillospiraceae bacterium PP1C4]